MNEFINELFESVEAGELTAEDAMTIVESFDDSDENDDVVEEAANDDIKKILDDIKGSFDENSSEYNKCIKYREFAKAEGLAKKMGKDIEDAEKAIAAIPDDKFSIASGAIGSFIKGASSPLAIGLASVYSISSDGKWEESKSKDYLDRAKERKNEGQRTAARSDIALAKAARDRAKEYKYLAKRSAAITGAATLGVGIIKSVTDVRKTFKETGSKNITRAKVNSALKTLKDATVNMERRAAMLKKLYRKTVNISTDNVDEM